MTIPTESYVQVAIDGSGKRIRNLAITALQGDGTPQTVYMQVTAIADDKGNVVDLDAKPILDEILLTNQRMATLLELLVGAFGGGASLDQAVLDGFTSRTVLTNPVPAQQLVNAISDTFGRQIIVPWGARDMFAVGIPATITDTTAKTLIAALPDTYLDLVVLLITNTSAATNSRVDVSDGTNTYSFQSIGGSSPVGFSSGLIIPATNKNTAWTVQAATAVTDLRVWALFVKNK